MREAVRAELRDRWVGVREVLGDCGSQLPEVETAGPTGQEGTASLLGVRYEVSVGHPCSHFWKSVGYVVRSFGERVGLKSWGSMWLGKQSA